MKRPTVLPLLLISPILLARGSSSLPISFSPEPSDLTLGHHIKIPETDDSNSQNITQTRTSSIITTTGGTEEHQNAEAVTAAAAAVNTNTNIMEASSSPSFAFPRNLLDFNVTLVGTTRQFLNGNSDDGTTLETTKEILEGFLLGGYLDMTAPILNLTLTQEGRFQLFPGSLIHTFSYSGTLFIDHLESSWNTFKVQQNQAGLLTGKEADVEEQLSNQGIQLLVDDISVASFDQNAVPQNDNDQVPTLDESVTRTPRIKKDPTSTYLAIAISLALVALLIFAYWVRRKSSQIKMRKESELDSRRKRMSEGVEEEEPQMDEDTGSDHTISSK
ncbi:unnamed protein product [Cylindrotheca closterium]|uniref:Uncharacterized protein n=1 Tax=Cylindrotheca closterium TaxID=2856 RepID=A0AAD2CVK9_9STRA|nr:unnamed protein product [Cylindrotheca closterium]